MWQFNCPSVGQTRCWIVYRFWLDSRIWEQHKRIGVYWQFVWQCLKGNGVVGFVVQQALSKKCKHITYPSHTVTSVHSKCSPAQSGHTLQNHDSCVITFSGSDNSVNPISNCLCVFLVLIEILQRSPCHAVCVCIYIC